MKTQPLAPLDRSDTYPWRFALLDLANTSVWQGKSVIRHGSLGGLWTSRPAVPRDLLGLNDSDQYDHELASSSRNALRSAGQTEHVAVMAQAAERSIKHSLINVRISTRHPERYMLVDLMTDRVYGATSRWAGHASWGQQISRGAIVRHYQERMGAIASGPSWTN